MEDVRKVGTFPHFDDKYKCCCRSIHITQGARVVIVVTIIFTLLTVATLLFGPSMGSTVSTWLFLFVNTVCLVCVFIGMKKNSSKYLIPMMVFSVFAIFYNLAVFIAHHIILSSPDSSFSGFLKDTIDHPAHAIMRDDPASIAGTDVPPEVHAMAMTVTHSTEVVLWIFDIFCFYVFYKYYIYLRDLERYYATLTNDVESRY